MEQKSMFKKYLDHYRQYRKRGYNSDIARRIAWAETYGTEELKTVNDIPAGDCDGDEVVTIRKEDLVDGMVEDPETVVTVSEVPDGV